MGVRTFFKKRSLKVSDDRVTKAADLSLRESIWPIALVTVLFFLWGFSYGLLDTLNKHFQVTLHIDRARSAGLQAAYFGAYPLASLGHAAWILRHYSYKAVFIWGLSLYAIGALIAIPCIKAKSFGGFCAAIFIIGNGLGSLETAANPFITVCGPPKYAEMRINMSQAFNGIGSVVAPVLGSYVFFNFDDQKALANVQWVYLSIAVFVLLLATLFLFSNIPEITDADMAQQAESSNSDSHEKPLSKQYRLFHASFAQFCYCGAQVAVASSKLFAGAQAAFAVGRFFGVFLMKYFKPRHIFLAFLSMCVVFICPAITERGDTGIAMLYVVLFFESICFPTIVALGMRGLGRHTKRGSGFIIGGVIGGACVPPLTGVAADRHGTGKAMVVPLAFFVAAWTFPLCVNVLTSYKKGVDAFENTDNTSSSIGEWEEKGNQVEQHHETVVGEIKA
ncbi:major facilitator superfamily transporter FHS family L-fucose permease [Fusarium beomiforme]|uniref:Major facilitator superfamily transporter FHS family L-fucose permease n=1 Tax=Fusarium beomiforme TaxID=44412 RepID=A0A9P5DYN3_9HYPO|nr:major facilitator superfamily transporter FHS family L-fucose permease [Fusarium beomiforme]